MDYCVSDSPIGPLLLAGDNDALTLIYFQNGRSGPRDPDPEWRERPATFRETTRQLSAYFAGRLRKFELPLRPEGTSFQRSVWDALLRIPYGATTSYGALARDLGKPEASRAVGLANGSNPIPIVIPCHRVIGASGKLTGYGGGLDLKRRLLDLERGPGLFDNA
jgi:methylated-DNA-[protein]-cysteine S-methyltransferase